MKLFHGVFFKSITRLPIEHYCPLNKKIYVPKQKDVLYLLTTKASLFYPNIFIFARPSSGNLLLG